MREVRRERREVRREKLPGLKFVNQNIRKDKMGSLKRSSICSLYFILALSIFGCRSQSQPLTKVNLTEDLAFLNKAIIAGHPVQLNESWNNELVAFITTIENQSTIDYAAFEYENIIREALSIVGCSHTVIKESPISKIYYSEIGENKYLPVRCYADSTGLYMLEASIERGKDSLIFPLNVLSINGISTKEIINKLLIYQPVDGHQQTLGYAIINKYAQILLRRCFIGTDDFTIQYQQSDETTGEFNIKAVNEYSPDEFRYFEPQSTPVLSNDLIGLFPLNQTSMYLRLKSMDYTQYKKTNATIFQHLNEKKIKNLIIDLRGNGGGKPESALYFLSYTLTDTLSQIDLRPNGNVSKYLRSKLKLIGVWFWAQITSQNQTESGTEYITNVTYPKQNPFKGKIYILTDGFTASSACALAAYLKHKTSAICVGQETAGGETGCNANSFQTLELPNSKITINFPIFRFNHQLSIPDNHHGIIPDYEIQYDAKTYLMNKDVEMEKVFELINEK
jgi:hypothetical protein